MKKSKLLIFGSIIALTMCSCGDETKAPITNDAVSISTLHGSFGVDVDSYAELAGDADYVFTGKVLEEANVEYKWPVTIENEDGSTREVTTPYTTYNVENIENIKGELSQDSPITVTKVGGISEDGSTYLVYENDTLPVVGITYVFYIYAQDDGSNLASGPNSTIPLDQTSDTGITTRAFTGNSDDSESVLDQIKEGVENQIVTERDRSVSTDDISRQNK